jgi:ribonuclease P protein component
LSDYTVLKKNQDFQTVFEKGHSIPGRYLVVYFHPNNLVMTRSGVCAGKKLGTAVTRNRCKRRLREALRPFAGIIRPGHDLVLLARNQLPKASLPEIRNDLKRSLDRARLLVTERLPGETEDSS